MSTNQNLLEKINELNQEIRQFSYTSLNAEGLIREFSINVFLLKYSNLKQPNKEKFLIVFKNLGNNVEDIAKKLYDSDNNGFIHAIRLIERQLEKNEKKQ